MEQPIKPHQAERGQKTTLVGIAVNIGLVLIKGTAGWLGHSYALIADAMESGTDIVTSIFVWFGLRTASKAPDKNHPYGHGKAEPLAAIVVALALVGAAILIAVQSIRNIQVPHEIPAPFTLAVLAGVVIVKEVLFRQIAKVGDETDSSAVKADAWHHRSDAITSLTAFVGISIALIGGPGYESADDWAALLASVVIVYNAYHIFRPSFGEIMDETPAGDWRHELSAIALTVPQVKGIDKYRVRKTGFEYFVDLHVLVPGGLTVTEGHAIAHAVKAAILKEKPAIYDVLVHIEPA
ncbi:cation diffusion facilitator family transporter [Spirosoma endophyticum]|uniref:Cation diffusion facilitator family transporter n=1 Tax=Spirosoma endophyticum TaxID=662367 RepID=A0A1I1QSU5_9BACT|nr:cation diffusion facilitator family transporter [Spirosoma endophyticum]SFD25095.1 cation diffusion facilitator family transporter [Spirosoma endophyticum]